MRRLAWWPVFLGVISTSAAAQTDSSTWWREAARKDIAAAREIMNTKFITALNSGGAAWDELLGEARREVEKDIERVRDAASYQSVLKRFASAFDFAACSSFKWLMGDFGTGFLYVREELLDKLQRPVVGYYQASSMVGHFPPFDSDAGTPVTYNLNKTASGVFESGTFGNTSLLRASLAYIKELGVANIEAHRQPLLKKLREEVPRFGFVPVTPPESTGGNITFAKRDVGRSELPRKLQAAKINVRFSTHWMRLSPSVYNDPEDIERFLEALA